MPGNREQETREKHPQRNHHRSRKRFPNLTVLEINALKPHECRKDDQRCGQDIPNGNTINKDALREPAAHQHGLDLYERDRRVCASEGERASHKTQDEEVDEGRCLCDAEG